MRLVRSDDPRCAPTVAAVVTAVLVTLLALAGPLALGAGCGDDTGGAFVGEWTSEAMGDAVVTVTKSGDEYTIELPNKTYKGKLEDEAVFAPFDDPTIVLEIRGDDLVMHFYKEENAILLKRVD